ncbi:MAG: hypothetical protein L3J39_10380 [Verrucomicrobiales bacterium]|nr:hypothetical protein [Verrucomicrobiales bacterium]
MMQDDELEESLMHLRQQPLPDLPSNMSSRVWRSIQRREQNSAPLFLAWPLWLAQPVMAVLFLALTMGFGFVYGSNLEGSDKQQELAWADAFDADSLYLPFATGTALRK